MLELRAVDAAREIVRIPADFVLVGSSYDFPLEVVATEAHLTALLAAELAGYVEVSTGGGFSAVPDDVVNGFDLGTFTAGQRKAITLRLIIPGTPLRTRSIEIHLGTGV